MQSCTNRFWITLFKSYEANNVKRVLELGGRDTAFFATDGIQVDALDYSSVAIDILNKQRKNDYQ